MNDDTAHESSSRPVLAVIVLIGALVTATSATFLRDDAWEPAIASPWWIPVAIVVGFALAERFSFLLEYRREAISFTMSEVPMVFALIYLGPCTAVIARTVVGLAVIVRKRPTPLLKVSFNGALFAFETAFAFAVCSWIVGRAGMSEPTLIIAVAASAAAATVVGAVAVHVAIGAFEGGFVRRLVAELPISIATGCLGAVVALGCVAPLFIRPEFVLFSVLPVIAVWSILARHGRLVRRHRDLESIHGFAGAIGRSLDLDDLAEVALSQVRIGLRSEHAMLLVYGENGLPGHAWSHGPDGLHVGGPADMERWISLRGLDDARCIVVGDDDRIELSAHASTDAAAVPLCDANGPLGLLVVTKRLGGTQGFEPDDVDRLSTIASQLESQLANAMVHARMEFAASHDDLTGEWNRAAFDRLVTDVLHAPYSGGARAAMMIDLDKFKEVNDTLGHHVGDIVLTEFAARIRRLLEPDDVFARFGGDEFALYVERPDPIDIRHLGERILGESYTAIEIEGLDVVVTSSIGIAAARGDDRDAAALLRRADIAMYTAKQQHAGCESYSEGIDRRTPERLTLLADLRQVLDRGLLEVHYQPKVDLVSSTVVGVEALVRWKHETRGWVPPEDFIPLAEESGLIRMLTDQVLGNALAATRRWHDDGFDLAVAVNLSTLDLLDELLVDRIARHLELTGLRPENLVLEITESSLMVETPRVMATIQQLDRLGVGLSLDDFGTGFSSLSYLRRLPVTELKIDRSFVGNLLLDPQDEVIVKSTIDLGHNLNLRVVAEGIENGPIFDRLRLLGCDLGQGYGISRPLPGDLLSRWLDGCEFTTRKPARPLLEIVAARS